MTVWYVDYEGGTDVANGVGAGDSFATRRKRITNISTAAAGDTVRIMASPDPTSLGQTAQWTDGPLAATLNITSSTNATPIVMTVTSHGYTTGDTVIIYGHTTNTNANGVWLINVLTANTFQLLNADGTNSTGNGVGVTTGTARRFTNAVVKLTNPVTKAIALTGNQGTKPNWTAANANVTCVTYTASYKEGYSSQTIAVAAAFTTGLAAYYTLPAPLDLSGYQQVSFWIYQTLGTIGAAGAVRLRLCTDTVGAVPVHDIPIPAVGVLNVWMPVTVDLGTNLNAAIQSVSFDVVTDNGAQTFYIDHIIACKASSAADSLTLTSLISKDPGDHSYGDTYECYWAIESINDKRIVLAAENSRNPAATPQRGYSGTTENVTTYKRETIKTVAAVSTTTQVQPIGIDGSAGNLVSFSGGWNRTDMSTQTGETVFDGQNGNGYGFNANSRNFFSLDKVNFTRYFQGLNIASSADTVFGRIETCSCSSAQIYIISTSYRCTSTVLSAVSGAGVGLILTGPASVHGTIGRADSNGSNGVQTPYNGSIANIASASNNASDGVAVYYGSVINAINKANGNGSSGIIFGLGANAVVKNFVSNNNLNYGISCSFSGTVLNGSTSGNYASSFVQNGATLSAKNCVFNESLELNVVTYAGGKVASENHDNTAGYSKIQTDYGLIETQTSVVHGSATRAWKFSPTSSAIRAATYPLNLAIAQIAVAANSLVTVKAWFRRSNTGLTGRLIAKGGQLSGVASDVYTAMTAIADTWEELTITFTPTESGVIEIEAQFWGGSTYNGYVSDLTITQS